jgi:hypothetical protein
VIFEQRHVRVEFGLRRDVSDAERDGVEQAFGGLGRFGLLPVIQQVARLVPDRGDVEPERLGVLRGVPGAGGGPIDV